MSLSVFFIVICDSKIAQHRNAATIHSEIHHRTDIGRMMEEAEMSCMSHEG